MNETRSIRCIVSNMEQIKYRFQKLFRKLTTIASLDDQEAFRKSFLKLHNHDRAKYLFALDRRARTQYYNYLTPKELARLFESIKPKRRPTFLDEMADELAADILAGMYLDNAVDTLKLLPAEKRSKLLALMKPAHADKIGMLMHYGDNTAGSIMTSELVAIGEEVTAGEALEIIKEQASKAVTVYYVYITDKNNRLSNVVSLKHLVLANKSTPVSKLGRDRVLSIQAMSDKIEAARMLRDYNFLALPVVDYEGHLVGVITVDDVVDLIDRVAASSYSHLAAVSDVELTDGALLSAGKRLPWLILLLFLGMMTATLIGQFESTLAKVAILGAFIPVIAGTTGNSGTQSLAIMVRGIATGKLNRLSLRRYFLKESITALTTSLVCGIVLAGIIVAWKQELYIGVVAGTALAASIFIGTLTGTFVPLLVRKFGADPAVASGPLITTVCDVISMAIYFGLATLLIEMLL